MGPISNRDISFVRFTLETNGWSCQILENVKNIHGFPIGVGVKLSFVFISVL